MADLESVAADIKGRRRGRPRSASPSAAALRERERAARKSQGSKPALASENDDRPPYVPTEESIVLSTILGKTLWGLSCMLTRHKTLTDEQARELGTALDPVLYKWLPLLEGWKAEATLIVVTWGLWSATKPDQPDK